MSDRGNIALRVLGVLTAYLTAADRVTADPSGSANRLGHLLAQRFRSSPDAQEIFNRFQQEPLDNDLRTAVHGRLTEAMLVDAGFASNVEAALQWAETSAAQQSANQSEFTVQLQGGMRGSAINQGSGTIDQSRRTRISFPLATLVVLLGGGVIVGGGTAIYTATSSDAGSYTYYMPPDQTKQDFLVVLDWRTQKNGDINGTWNHVQKDNNSQNLTITGHQNGSEIEIIVWMGPYSVNFHCTRDTSTSLTCQAPLEKGGQFSTGKMYKISKEKVGQIVAEYTNK